MTLLLLASLAFGQTDEGASTPAFATDDPPPERASAITTASPRPSFGFGVDGGLRFPPLGPGWGVSLEGRLPLNSATTVDIQSNIAATVLSAALGGGFYLDGTGMWHRQLGDLPYVRTALAIGGTAAVQIGGGAGVPAGGGSLLVTGRIGGDFRGKHGAYETGVYFRPSVGPTIAGAGGTVVVLPFVGAKLELTFQWALPRAEAGAP
ncbi:MAG: hypothetical protein RLZZ383_1421 [Pseudomonadota bacterium]|jgi:hypothetical protein